MDKTKKFNVLFLIFLILLSNYAEARKSGGGGFGSRGGGGSAARANPAPHPAPAGGFGGQPRPAAPHPGPVGGGGFAGGRPPPAAGAGPGHLGTGTGLGSASRVSSFKTALAGAAIGAVGGVLAFEAGKAIIKSMDRPMHYDNKDYYFGQEYVKRSPDDHICSYDYQELMKQTAPPAGTTVNATAEENNKALAQATFPNGTRPKQIVWACKKWEQCCGMDCCPMPQSVSRTENNKSSALSTLGKVLLIITLVSLLFCCCCFVIVYKFFRSAFDSLFSRDSNNSYDPSKYENNTVNSNMMPAQQPNNPVQPVQAQSYPMHPYPNQPSQQPGGVVYPSQPSNPPAYPAYPPAPGYYDSQQQKY
uniref:CX domain-containing protein n=1 Tax=Meloidogyne incognita TaxID=6306 RepID=A0A914LDS8_MELIC